MVFTRRRWLALTGAVVFGLAQSLAVDPAKAQSSDVVVFAAASLKNALDDINAAWTKETGKKAVISYASSPALAKQIEQSAPADLFISADLDWMDYVAERKLIKAETRGNLLGNRLVLVGSKGSPPLAVKAGVDLSGALKGGKLAVANVDSVPAGKYGKAAMEKLGVWESVKDKLAQSENVRAALLLVSRGEAPLGIVYKTDAAADPNLAIVGEFPEDTHPPIFYPAAITANSKHGDASAFLAFLRSPTAKALFEKQGFTVLAAERPRS
jgi:molybdate transport system substrate-binding protein